MAVDQQTAMSGRHSRSGARARLNSWRGPKLAFWLLLPTALALVAVIGYPLASAVQLSFYTDTISGIGGFAGLSNYTSALFGDEASAFWGALTTTLFFAAICVPVELLLGLGFALLMHGEARSRGVMRGVVLLPWAIPLAIGTVMFQWMFQPAGIINAILGTEILWTGKEWSSRLAIIVIDVWKHTPFMALLLLAGLQTIPADLHEAAKMDGAGAWSRFRHITVPLLRPAFAVAILFRTVEILALYDVPAILTKGANGTETIAMLIFDTAIGELRPGLGAALSTLTFITILCVALVLIRLLSAGRSPRGAEA